MTDIQTMWLTLGVFFAVLLALVLTAVIRHRKQDGAKTAPHAEWVDIEPTVIKMHARVLDQRCFTAWTGTKMPRSVKHFVVAFQDDHGQTHEMEVREDLYDCFEIGQVGELTLIDGRVAGYVLEK